MYTFLATFFRNSLIYRQGLGSIHSSVILSWMVELFCPFNCVVCVSDSVLLRLNCQTSKYVDPFVHIYMWIIWVDIKLNLQEEGPESYSSRSCLDACFLLLWEVRRLQCFQWVQNVNMTPNIMEKRIKISSWIFFRCNDHA